MKAPAAPALAMEPDLETARQLSREGNVVPIRLRLVDDCETPVSALLKLRGSGPCFLLESAEQGQVGRYSFLGFRPRSILRWSGESRTLVEDLPADPEWEQREQGIAVDAPDPYAAVADYLARFRLAPVEDLPPFAGGAVGFFGYDLVRTVEPLGDPNPDPLGLPDMALMVTDVMLAFDHLRHELTILACAFVDQDGGIDAAYARATAAIADVRERLRGPVPAPLEPAVSVPPEFTSNMERDEFEGAVRRIIDYIYAGDAFQVVPSQRFSADAAVEPLSIYRGLRAVNPSPYMYFLEFGDFQLAGASPEPLVKVTGRRVETRPIAGTYPRGASEEEDRRLAERLVNDPKERAEHVMLVDLGRNDLGRVCEYGSISVDELMVVETYSHVLHIVSQVSGTLREEVSSMDVLRSALPAGTLSGAPKVRAMQIIDELEPHKRGSYGGAIGYLSWSGDLDTAIHIRTVVVKDGRVHVQAGGGTVADADPAYEYNESVNKARAIFRAVELACEQPDWP